MNGLWMLVPGRAPRVLRPPALHRRWLSERTRRTTWALPPVPPGVTSPQTSPSPAKPRRSPPTTQSPIHRLKDSTNQAKALSGHGRAAPGARNVPKQPVSEWSLRKAALMEKYPEGWKPSKRLSPDALEGIRILHRQRPQFTNTQLGKFFRMSPEAIRRILKSRWTPAPEEQVDRINRWNRWRQRATERAITLNAFRTKSTALHRHRTRRIFPLTMQTKPRMPTQPENKYHHRNAPG